MIEFLRKVLETGDYCLLLQEHPGVADSAAQVFKLSPYLAEQLAYHPELLEEVRRVVDHPTRRWAFEGLAAPLNDVEGLRNFYSREMVRIQTASICLAEPVFQTLDRTSAMAEFLIARAYRIARERSLAHARQQWRRRGSFTRAESSTFSCGAKYQ